MADVDVVKGAPAPDGRGTCCLSGPIDIPEDFLWGPLTNKVYHFNEYFRTTEYSFKDLPDGRMYRNMVIDDERFPQMEGTRTIEHIVVDKHSGVVEFTLLDPETEQPTGVKRYNILHRNPLRIEYAELSADGVKTPLSNGDVIKQQIKQAYEAWQQSLKK
eukprot:TRINITY_DN17968_c0_g1_i1.p2 TRINITY_DN17968_c0_g1~~TRINITY_DN17968_c0_g1_i1.p2  ORF type:complete len:160 (-),score=46.13 TRINITY_DN17968_c0_g1_i1:283-762(-)